MSITLMSVVWRMDLPPTEKIVLIALADAANDDGVTWIPVRSRKEGKLDLLTKCSLSERALQGAIKRLQAGGHLTRQENPGKGVLYTIHPAGEPDAGGQIPTPAAAAPRTTCAPQQTTQTPAAAAGKPSVTVITSQKTTSSSRTRARAKPASTVVCPDFLDQADWDDFLVVRKSKGAAPTDGALRRIIKKLEVWRAQGHDPTAIVERSITSNWADVFEPKDEQNGNLTRNPNWQPRASRERRTVADLVADRMAGLG